MNIVAVVPARGGSKGIPLKNIQPLCGRPLLSFTIEAAKQAGFEGNIFVSTDSKEIAKVALAYGAKVINRPANISGDKASTEAVLLHAVESIQKEIGKDLDYILTLPPTSPLRKGRTIKNFLDYFLKINNRYDAMLSLTETKQDFWVKEDGFRRLFADAPRRRQDRKPLYVENSAIYITKVGSLKKTHSILGQNCTGFVIDELEAVDINGPNDIKWAQFVLEQKLLR